MRLHPGRGVAPTDQRPERRTLRFGQPNDVLFPHREPALLGASRPEQDSPTIPILYISPDELLVRVADRTSPP